jgi:hypothetical protein
MGTSLIPSGGLLPSKLDRAISKELVRIDAATELGKHSDRQRIDRIMEATQRGQVAAAAISGTELTLVRGFPHAQARISAIADAGAMGLVRVVYEAGQ